MSKKSALRPTVISNERGRQLGIRAVFGSVMVAVMVGAAACGSSSNSSTSTSATTPLASVRLGYLSNLTHASAIAGVSNGYFAKYLGTTQLQTQVFTAGPQEVQALLANSLDLAYIGPSPAIQAFEQSQGQAVQVVSGSASGGAALVVKASITTPSQLKGTKLATPQLGNTQDVALRFWLSQNGLSAPVGGGGNVTIVPQDNSTTLTQFSSGGIDGAWIPEPYSTRLVTEAGGHVLVNEASLWPNGKFATTVLVVRKAFLAQYPNVVREIIQGQVDANNFLNSQPGAAQTLVNNAIAQLSGKQLKPAVLTAAWSNITFTDDPIAASFLADAAHANSVGLSAGSVKLSGLFNLDILNQVLKAKKESPVPGIK